MKILHISTSLNHGGAEAVLTRLVLADRDNQHEVVSLLGDGDFGQMLREAGVPVYPLDIGSLVKSVKSFLSLIKILRRVKPDVVQCWMYHANLFGALAALFAGVKRVAWNLRTIPNEWLSRQSQAIISAGAMLSKSLPTAIVCAGSEVSAAHSNHGYDATKLVTIGNGIDTCRFKPDRGKGLEFRHQLGIGTDEWIVGRIGRDAAQKDHATLFAALAELDRRGNAVRCLLVGRGMEKENLELRALARDADVDHLLIFAGHRDDVEAVANAIDVLVSSSRVEGFPNAIAEAMACGTPAVSTDAGASAQIVGPTGWIVPVGEGKKLAEMIGQAREVADQEPKRWSAMKSACVERIAVEFSMQSMLRAYQDLWRRMLRPEPVELTTNRLEAAE